MQDIQFLEFSGSHLTHSHSNYLICIRFIQVITKIGLFKRHILTLQPHILGLKITCLGNVKQVAISVMQYSNGRVGRVGDNDGMQGTACWVSSLKLY